MDESDFGKKFYKKVTVDGKTVGKWVVFVGFAEYDDDCNDIHRVKANGYEEWNEYDENGNMISKKTSNDDKIIYKVKCNSEGKIVHREGSDGEEKWWEYDESGNKIYEKTLDSNGYEKEWFYEYNDENKCVHQKNFVDGDISEEAFYELNEKGYKSHTKALKDGEEFNFWNEYEYWENGKPQKAFVFRAL